MAFPAIYDFDHYEGDTNTFEVAVKDKNGNNFLEVPRIGTTYEFLIASERSPTASLRTAGSIVTKVTPRTTTGSIIGAVSQSIIPSGAIASGLTGTVTFAITPTLPTGVGFNVQTGQVSGIPQTTSASTIYTITATSGSQTTETKLTIAIPAVELILCTLPVNLSSGQYVYSVRQNQPALGGAPALVYTFVTGTITVKSKVSS